MTSFSNLPIWYIDLTGVDATGPQNQFMTGRQKMCDGKIRWKYCLVTSPRIGLFYRRTFRWNIQVPICTVLSNGYSGTDTRAWVVYYSQHAGYSTALLRATGLIVWVITTDLTATADESCMNSLTANSYNGQGLHVPTCDVVMFMWSCLAPSILSGRIERLTASGMLRGLIWSKNCSFTWEYRPRGYIILSHSPRYCYRIQIGGEAEVLTVPNAS